MSYLAKHEQVAWRQRLQRADTRRERTEGLVVVRRAMASWRSGTSRRPAVSPKAWRKP